MVGKARRAEAARGSGSNSQTEPLGVALTWLQARYHLHTFCYRDPRSAFSSALGLPVVSPTAVLLGIASTLFSIGKSNEALAFNWVAEHCQVVVDSPDGAVFFRAFHQLRRYISPTKGKTHRAGFTDMNQGTKEYALVDGTLTLFVGVPSVVVDTVKLALRNRDHLGTHDSLCALLGDVEECAEPTNVIYLPPECWQTRPPKDPEVTIVTLSRFKRDRHVRPAVGDHWWMAGGDDTERVAFMIKGHFLGTTRGRIYRKCP